LAGWEAFILSNQTHAPKYSPTNPLSASQPKTTEYTGAGISSSQYSEASQKNNPLTYPARKLSPPDFP
jgi:hypothetical protein